MKRHRRLLFVLSLVFLICLLTFAFIHTKVHGYDTRIVSNTEKLETNDWARPRVAIVFGASVYSNGELSPTLEERVETAISLYKAGKVDRVLVSGDNRHLSYNEPKAMQEYLVTHAVAPQDVVVDYAGRSTYDTCRRAREIFGLSRAVLVTQQIHLSRALYLANELGIDALGVATDPEGSKFSAYQFLRESAAEVKAYFNLWVVAPRTVLGEKLPIK